MKELPQLYVTRKRRKLSDAYSPKDRHLASVLPDLC